MATVFTVSCKYQHRVSPSRVERRKTTREFSGLIEALRWIRDFKASLGDHGYSRFRIVKLDGGNLIKVWRGGAIKIRLDLIQNLGSQGFMLDWQGARFFDLPARVWVCLYRSEWAGTW